MLYRVDYEIDMTRDAANRPLLAVISCSQRVGERADRRCVGAAGGTVRGVFLSRSGAVVF
jgi:hypothetical protein